VQVVPPFLRRISLGHQLSRHGLDMGKNRKKYPGKETRERLSQSVSGQDDPPGHRWTLGRLRKEILRRSFENRPLNIRGVMIEDKPLYKEANRRFGSWDQALKEFGFDPDQVRRRRHWTKPFIVCEIRRLSQIKEYGQGLRLARKRPDLAKAAAEAFGSWRAAVERAGMATLSPMPVQWTRQAVIDRIHELAKRGHSLDANDVDQQQRRLMKAAGRLFREPWPDLIRNLGYLHEGEEHWTPEKIVQALQYLERELGRPEIGRLRRRLRHVAKAVLKLFARPDVSSAVSESLLPEGPRPAGQAPPGTLEGVPRISSNSSGAF
jgi:hypothetical protein